MEKIVINHHIVKEETIYGSLKFNNVIFNASAIENYLLEYVLDKTNLEYIFCSDCSSDKEYLRMLERFEPKTKVSDVQTYVISKMASNKSFYSFFSEALLPLVYRDIYNYELQAAALDINHTLVDTETGADSCLFDKSKNAFVLGEAKFYKSFDEGLKKIISNFKKDNSLINKLENLRNTLRNNDKSDAIILNTLGKEWLDEYSLEEFLGLNINFAGLVLHEAESIDMSKINDDNFYDNYVINATEIYDNLKSLSLNKDKCNFTITLFHFFIDSKKEMIIKCINKAKELKEIVRNGK